MRVAVDSSMFLLLIDPSVPVPPTTRDVLAAGSAQARLGHFVDSLAARNGTIIIPTPVLTEVLVRADDSARDTLDFVERTRGIEVAPLDKAAAYECGTMLRAVWTTPKTRSKAKLKFDHQIVAIAKVRRASMILTDDDHVAKLADRNGIMPRGIWDLPAPPEAAQGVIPFPRP